MKRITALLAVLCLAAVAAENTAVVPQAATGPKPQAPTLEAEATAISIPQMLSYQGRVTDTLGQPVPNGSYPMMFLLYTTPSGGSSFWSENQSVTTQDGLFSVLLGSSTPIGSIPDAGAVYLAMTISGGPELTPRIHIVSSAFAYLSGRAANADLLQGRDTSAFVRTGQTDAVTSAMLVDGTIAAADLSQMGASSGQVMKWTGSAWQPRNDSVGSGGEGDSAWVRVGSDSVLYTIRRLGIARGGAGNVLHGDSAHTHVNLGVACTTGTSGEDHAYCTVGGGNGNHATGFGATVNGGSNNDATGDYSTVSGGGSNNAAGYSAAVGGGRDNVASATFATVGGGSDNAAEATHATVAGGYNNDATGYGATVGGGFENTADTSYATVGGGFQNTTSGNAAMVPGGYRCAASGNRSFAAGSFAKARGVSSFVWSDSCSEGDSVRTTTNNRWVARARGGVYFYTNLGMTTGSYLSAGGSSWNSVSDSMTKENFRPVDKQALLEALARMRVRDYNLKSQDASVRHIGPVAQDFYGAFGFGESNTAINMEDADGVALAAIQALYEDNRQLRQEVEALKARLAGLK